MPSFLPWSPSLAFATILLYTFSWTRRYEDQWEVSCYFSKCFDVSTSQFRAAWKRVRGKEKIKAPTTETIVNQISDGSSLVECSFPNFEKKKKSRLKGKSTQGNKLINFNQSSGLKSINESLSCNNNNNNKNVIVDVRRSQILQTPAFTDIEIMFPEQRAFLFARSLNKTTSRNENNYELRMFSSEANIYGKAIHQLIRNNSYKSNIC